MINAANEHIDTLGELLKKPAKRQRGYNANQWQCGERAGQELHPAAWRQAADVTNCGSRSRKSPA